MKKVDAFDVVFKEIKKKKSKLIICHTFKVWSSKFGVHCFWPLINLYHSLIQKTGSNFISSLKNRPSNAAFKLNEKHNRLSTKSDQDSIHLSTVSSLIKTVVVFVEHSKGSKSSLILIMIS